MSKLRNIVVATGAAIVSASVASLALANFPAGGSLNEMDSLAIESDAVAIPAPVVGAALFVAASSGNDTPVCMTQDRVVASLKGEEAVIGGSVVMLEDGLEQDFADEWRRETGVAKVGVSSVVAHLFDDGAGSGIADVVEFDMEGCAMSRTLLSGSDWTGLLRQAAGNSADA